MPHGEQVHIMCLTVVLGAGKMDQVQQDKSKSQTSIQWQPAGVYSVVSINSYVPKLTFLNSL